MFKITLFNNVRTPTTSIFFKSHILTISLPLGSSLLKYEYVYFIGLMWHSKLAAIQFDITFPMPKPDDKRTHGYSPKYIKKLQISITNR
jgi:hypothetical protein